MKPQNTIPKQSRQKSSLLELLNSGVPKGTLRAFFYLIETIISKVFEYKTISDNLGHISVTKKSRLLALILRLSSRGLFRERHSLDHRNFISEYQPIFSALAGGFCGTHQH